MPDEPSKKPIPPDAPDPDAEEMRDALNRSRGSRFGTLGPSLLLVAVVLVGGLLLVSWISREAPERLAPTPSPHQLPGVGGDP